ncbi:hypothetical protein [Marinoscillum furvescens]|uniref:Uncharacterized protein n=1 Tax=Marinoscillum furvescens DSM 4134 TaxID=1122208 RepID=A0A3D9KZA1_MARFU|nr:hypothetical protein [Marinoscillum furvescens]RED93034.1 hypothetical protein C7460_12758 [Marinoscillum furvescens DSM 4134]
MEQYIEDLKEIKDIMNRSSRFISLSGWSGVSAGVTALVGAYFAYQTVYTNQNYLGYRQAQLSPENLVWLIGIAITTLIIAIGSGVFFTTQVSKKNNQPLWDSQTKRLLINLSIPLITGGMACLILLSKGFVGIIAPLTLVFYGLALVNASKYTLQEIRSLGITEIILGLIAMHFIGFGLLFWSIGFGLLHIGYGIFMQIKYRP